MTGRRTLLLLTGVLSLSSADTGATGALGPQLEHAFHIGTVDLGLLVTVSSLVGALAAIPVGALADRCNRVQLLAGGVASWAVAMVVAGLATDYAMLLVTRLALGIVMAVAGPVVPSLLGDSFDADRRSRVYGYLLTGELLGGGAGLLVAGNLGAALGWRVTYFVLAAPSVVLAAFLATRLREPARRRRQDAAGSAGSRMSLRRATRCVLSIRSNVAIILASALGYFFFAGMQTFAVIYARGRFRLSPGEVSLLVVVIGAGGAIGTLGGGHLTDRLLRRGLKPARLVVSGAAFAAAAALFVPGFVSADLAISLPVFVVGAALLGAPNPALDAARLDVVPGWLWGRAEAIRSFVKAVLEAAAPLVFGAVSAAFGGAHAGSSAGNGSAHVMVSFKEASGIGDAFLIMLIPLAASGLVLLAVRRRYLSDMEDATGMSEPPGGASETTSGMDALHAAPSVDSPA